MMTLKMVGMIFDFFYHRKKLDDGIKKISSEECKFKDGIVPSKQTELLDNSSNDVKLYTDFILITL